MPEKKSLSAKEVVADIRAGATDEFLIAKYGISKNGLQSLFRKLQTAKYITQAEMDRRAPAEKAKAVVKEGDSAKPSHFTEDRSTPKSGSSIGQSGPASTGSEKSHKQPEPSAIKSNYDGKNGRRFGGIVAGVVLVGVVTILALILPFTVVLGLFIDFAANVGTSLLICCLVAFIIAKIRKAESTATYFQKAAWVALVMAMLATIPSITEIFEKSVGRPTSFAQLTDQQSRRFKEIIKGVMSDPTYLTPAVRREFRQILSDMGGTKAQVQKLRERMTGVITVYQPLFWQDALIAFQTGSPHKSRRRADYEKRMIAKGLISAERVRKNDILISKVAAHEPIAWKGQEVLLNEELIRYVLNTIQETAARVDGLFPSPGK